MTTQNEAKGVLCLTVLVGGRAMLDAPLLRALVRHQLNHLPIATLTFRDGDPSTQAFALIDSDDFKPGVEITLKAGWGDRDDVIFCGKVVKQGIRVGGDKICELVIDCVGPSVAATHAGSDAADAGQAGANSPAVLDVAYGESLIEFSAAVDSRATLPGPVGRLSLRGSAQAVAGGVMALRGLGRRFSGQVQTTGITHTLANGDWVTECEFGQSVTSP